MADPTNTPMPPGTPMASTPRSSSPAIPYASETGLISSTATVNGIKPSFSPRSGTTNHAARTGGESTPSPPHPSALPSRQRPRLRVLHIGDPVKYNMDTYTTFSAQFEIIRPSTPERERAAFKEALLDGRWGDISAIFRPFWGTGGEMGVWDEELITLLPLSVKVFASAGAGFDWADVKLLGERGITYCNSGLAAAEAVADFALAMIISTFRHIPWCTTAATASSPTRFQDCHARATAESHNLRGHALGLVGLGNIGQQIASRCRLAFGMDIHYHDVQRKARRIETALSAHFHDSLADLLAASDCVVLCVPGGDPVITTDTIPHFRHGARFVNVARGSLVDEDALADALESGIISSVALDVHADEPNVNPRLLRFAPDRAMLTCHNAGGTVETHRGFEELSMRNIMAVLAGDEAITPVNLEYLRKSEKNMTE